MISFTYEHKNYYISTFIFKYIWVVLHANIPKLAQWLANPPISQIWKSREGGYSLSCPPIPPPLAPGDYMRLAMIEVVQYVSIYVNVCMYLCTNTLTYIYTYAHTHTYIHTYICIYVCMCVCIWVETRSDHPGHDLSRSSESNPVYKISVSDPDSALNHVH